jgi:hypothetical protein
MLNSSLSIHRSVFVALAAIALMAVLLRPVCELWSAHVGGGAAAASAATLAASAPFAHIGDAAAQCCANVSDAQRIAPWQALSGGAKAFGGVAPAALVAILTGIAILAWQPRWHRAPPRRPESFYLRSARILR